MSIKVDENDPVGELEPSFPYRDVVIRRNVDMKEFYDLESEIGRGKFGTVYRCREKSTGLTLAAKFVGIARREDRRNVEREVTIMGMLQHPRIIQLYDAFEASNVMCVVQELIEGGELFDRVIGDDFILTEKSCTVFVRQICEGVAFIHSKNVLHLDLKPENILCLTRTGNRIKIIDFGLARQYDPSKKLQVLFGTPEFVAPEVVNFDAIAFGTDMWSIGVICYVLLSGLSPFMGETDVETMANVTIAQYDFDDEAFDDISEEAKDFIKKLLVKNKDERYTAVECLSHPWLLRRPPLLLSTELDVTKENLIETVERWNSREPSPAKVVTLPPTPPTTPDTIIELHTVPHLTPLVKPEPALPVMPPLPPTITAEPTLPAMPLPTPLSTPTITAEPALPEMPPLTPLSTPTITAEPALPAMTPMTPLSTPEPAVLAIPSLVPFEDKPVVALAQYLPVETNKNMNSKQDSNATLTESSSKGVKNPGDPLSLNPSKQLKLEREPLSKDLKITSPDEVKVSTFNWSKKTPAVKSQVSVPEGKLFGKTKNERDSISGTSEKQFPSKFPLKSTGPMANFNSRIQQGGTEITISKKTLNPSPQPPKIAGIVLGQTHPRGTDISIPKKELPKPSKNIIVETKPKVITHKIIVEGKDTVDNLSTEQVKLPPSVPLPNKIDNQPRLNPLLRNLHSDRFERRCSDISCFLHDVESSTGGVSLINEIKKLSTRLFESDLMDESNNNSSSSLLRQIANRGVGPRRPKFRVTNLNRDVPLGVPPPPSNMTYFIPPNPLNHENYSSQTHSAPQSPRSSPDRTSEMLDKDVIMRLFNKMEGRRSNNSSIESVSNFVRSTTTKKKVTSLSSK